MKKLVLGSSSGYGFGRRFRRAMTVLSLVHFARESAWSQECRLIHW
jgi:hypothetical protein